VDILQLDIVSTAFRQTETVRASRLVPHAPPLIRRLGMAGQPSSQREVVYADSVERKSMTSPVPESEQGLHTLDGRTPEQVAMERSAQKVSDVLLNLEHSIAAAKKALKVVEKDGVDTNAELALKDLIPQLERARKRLQQDTYFSGDNLRLI
jgi:hypothetical protein